MPALPVPGRVPGGTATATFLGAGGREASASIPVNPNAIINQVGNIFTAMGNMSNAAVYKQGASATLQVPKNTVSPFDESYSGVEAKAVFTFQDADLKIIQIAIPAPDESIFGGDGETVDLTNTLVADFVTRVQNYLNESIPAGTFNVVRGFYSATSRKAPKAKTVRPSIEPPALALPPALPG